MASPRLLVVASAMAALRRAMAVLATVAAQAMVALVTAAAGPATAAVMVMAAETAAAMVPRRAVMGQPSSVRLFNGVIAEYREDSGRLLGVMTGVRDENGDVLLQHMMLWPKVDPSAMLRMLRDVENEAWQQLAPARIFLDVEHNHPSAEGLRALAARRGFKFWHADTTTTWFVKEREG